MVHKETFDFESLTQFTAAMLMPRGYEARGPFAEHHESWVTVFQKSKDTLDRFIHLGITIMDAVGEYEVEIYVSAQQNRRCVRRQVSTFAVSEESFYHHQWGDIFRQSIHNAADIADRMSVHDLSESYTLEPVGAARAAL